MPTPSASRLRPSTPTPKNHTNNSNSNSKNGSQMKVKVFQEVKERSKRRRLSLPSTINSTTTMNPEKAIKRRRMSRRFSNPMSQNNHDDNKQDSNNKNNNNNNDKNNNNGQDESVTQRRSSSRLRQSSSREESTRSSSKENQSDNHNTTASSSNTKASNNNIKRRSDSDDGEEESLKQGPTPYYKVVQERGGEMSPRLTRSASKSKTNKPIMAFWEKPPLANYNNNNNNNSDKNKNHSNHKTEGVLVFSPPNEEHARKWEEAQQLEHDRRVQQAKDEGRLLVFTPPRHGEKMHSLDPEESSDVTSGSGNTKMANIRSKQMDALASEIKIVREQQGALIQANEEARQKEAEAQSRYDELMKEKFQLVEERAALKLELEKTKTELQRLQGATDADMEELAQQNERLEDENAMLVAQGNNDRAQLKSLGSELETCLQQIDRLENKILPASKKQLEEAQMKLKMHEEKMAVVQKEATEYQQQIETLKQQLESAMHSNETRQSDYDATLQALEEAKAALQMQLQEANEAMQTKLDENRSLEKEKSSYADQIQKLQNELKESQTEHEKHANEVRAEMETIARDNEHLEQENEKLNLAIQENEKKLMGLTDEMELLREKVSFLENSKLPEKDAELESALKDLRSEQLKVSDLDAKVSQFQEQLDTKENEIAKLKETHEIELCTLKQQNEESADAIEQLRIAQAEKEDKLKQMETEISGKEAQVQELNDRTAELDDALNETMVQLEESNAASAAMRASLDRMQADSKGEIEVSFKKVHELEQMLQEALEREAALKETKYSQLEKLASMESKLQEKTREHDKYKQFIAVSGDRERELHEQLMESDQVRRDLHARVMQLMGNIRVFVRVRPMSSDERAQEEEALQGNQQSIFKFPSISDRRTTRGQKQDSVETLDLTKKTIEVLEPKKDRGGLKERRARHQFHFDNVFQQNHNQCDVWESTEPLVQSTVDGYNVTLFAYGQTGSGKTYTMLGEPGNEGIVTRSIKKLFSDKSKIEKLSNGKNHVEIKVEILEIYNENVYDLLSSSRKQEDRKSLKVSMVTNTIEGNLVEHTSTEAECMELLNLAQKRRCIKSTSSNAESSRSHLVFTIHFVVSEGEAGVTRKGKLNICDLAGSERLSKSETHFVGGALLQETKNINKSLSALSNVIEQLQAGNKTVAYRDSKLTSLLCDSLGGGNSKTLAVVCCCPLSTHYHESLSSLRFAEKASKVELKSSAAGFSC
ncbi:hypothetical protein ACA910_010912 [Epithemia clementina (nom. ined.)]